MGLSNKDMNFKKKSNKDMIPFSYDLVGLEEFILSILPLTRLGWLLRINVTPWQLVAGF